jgi:hypothetical protein
MKGTIMNKFLILSALLAAAVPQAVFAAETTAGITADASTHYDIVDAESGRIVGMLVPVAGGTGTLRIIGTVRSQPVLSAERPSTSLPPPLSASQFIEQRQREIDAQFHVDHSS